MKKRDLPITPFPFSDITKTNKNEQTKTMYASLFTCTMMIGGHPISFWLFVRDNSLLPIVEAILGQYISILRIMIVLIQELSNIYHLSNHLSILKQETLSKCDR